MVKEKQTLNLNQLKTWIEMGWTMLSAPKIRNMNNAPTTQHDFRTNESKIAETKIKKKKVNYASIFRKFLKGFVMKRNPFPVKLSSDL